MTYHSTEPRLYDDVIFIFFGVIASMKCFCLFCVCSGAPHPQEANMSFHMVNKLFRLHFHTVLQLFIHTHPNDLIHLLALFLFKANNRLGN